MGFTTGLPGLLLFLLLAGAWGLAFTASLRHRAKNRQHPAAVNSSFILFFPFAFLTTTFLPQEALTGWLSTIADYNPVTYLLEALRSLISEGWSIGPLLRGIGAISAVAAVSFTLAMTALKGRVSRG